MYSLFTLISTRVLRPFNLTLSLLMVQGVVNSLVAATYTLEPLEAQSTTAPQVVRYEDFGAVGNGRTDDFDAIIAAHCHANLNGLSVRAQDGATYYIGAGNRNAEIRTDTDFGTASFIIDDREVAQAHRSTPVFKVVSDHSPITLQNAPGFRKDQKRVDVRLPLRSLLIPVDAGTRRYNRRGGNQGAGESQLDVLLVDPDGTIDSATPPTWDFTAITKLTAYPVDTKPLRISGGRFTTIANQAPSNYTYYKRGLDVERSRVKVEGLTHLVTGEGETGAPYLGFIGIINSSDVEVRNCIFTPRKTYSTIGSAGTPVNMGSYDLFIRNSVNVSFVGCTQTTDFQDTTRWPIMGSNGSKNLLYDGCVLSRFDSHAGLNNATIRNSRIRYISVVGSGTLLIENSTITNHTLIDLRNDFGSTWDGEVIIRDCVLAPPLDIASKGISIIQGQNDGQFDFGYPCIMTTRIVIDGLKILDQEKDANVILRVNLGKADGPYPCQVPKEVVTSRITTSSGGQLTLSNAPESFKHTHWIKK
jgi:hypothetical protein